MSFHPVLTPGTDQKPKNPDQVLKESIQTACYRYWCSGIWTDFGREICRRTEAILNHNF